MKGIVVTFISISLVLLFISCKKNVQSNTLSIHYESLFKDKIDSIATSFITEGKVMGLSIVVQKKGKTFYNRGFGYVDSARTKSVKNDNIFLMASISKLIGATVVMKLVDEGRLSLDQSLYDLLPDYPNEEQAKKVKLHHLISHTSGLPEYTPIIDTIYVRTGKAPLKKDYYEIFEKTPSFYEPGEGYLYNNSGYVLMAMIVEHITGNTYQAEIDRIINKPLAINIKLIKQATNHPNTSQYFILKDTSLIPTKHWTWIKGDGGLTATTGDLLKFHKGWSNGAIISKKSYNEMITPRILNNGIKSGYGLGVRTGEFGGEKIIGRTGGHFTRWAHLANYPGKDLTLLVFVNTDGTTSNAGAVASAISLVLLDKPVPNFKDNNEVPIDNLKQYEGIYVRHQGGDKEQVKIHLNPEDNHLYYTFTTSTLKGEKMYYSGSDSFWIERWPMDRLVFDKNKGGNIVAFKEYYDGFFHELRQKTN